MGVVHVRQARGGGTLPHAPSQGGSEMMTRQVETAEAEVLCVDCEARPPMPGVEWCDDCNTARGEAQDEAAYAAFHGGSAPFTSDERMAVAYDALRGRRK